MIFFLFFKIKITVFTNGMIILALHSLSDFGIVFDTAILIFCPASMQHCFHHSDQKPIFTKAGHHQKQGHRMLEWWTASGWSFTQCPEHTKYCCISMKNVKGYEDTTMSLLCHLSVPWSPLWNCGYISIVYIHIHTHVCVLSTYMNF